jgi:hypothetical protein
MLVAWLLIAPVIAVVLSPALRRKRRGAARSTGDDQVMGSNRGDPR